MSKFQKGNKIGGNKPKPYKTKQLRKHIPEDLLPEIIEHIETKYKEYVKNLKISLKD